MISTNKGLYTRPVRRDDVRRVFTIPEHSVGPARTEPCVAAWCLYLGNSARESYGYYWTCNWSETTWSPV